MPYQAGPISAAGKRASSVNHNGCSEKLIVEGERLEDFHSLLASSSTIINPSSLTSKSLVEAPAHGRWILWRRQRTYTNIESAVYALQPNEAKWTLAEFNRIALAGRYRTTPNAPLAVR